MNRDWVPLLVTAITTTFDNLQHKAWYAKVVLSWETMRQGEGRVCRTIYNAAVVFAIAADFYTGILGGLRHWIKRSIISLCSQQSCLSKSSFELKGLFWSLRGGSSPPMPTTQKQHYMKSILDYHFWTEEEDDNLRTLHREHWPLSEIARILNKTVEAIRHRKRKLHLGRCLKMDAHNVVRRRRKKQMNICGE